MLIDFFDTVRRAKVPCSIREYLDLVEAVQARVAFADLEEFYALARLILVKDEKHYDKFDKAFAAYFEGIEAMPSLFDDASIPAEWMRKEMEKLLSASTRVVKVKIKVFSKLATLIDLQIT